MDRSGHRVREDLSAIGGAAGAHPRAGRVGLPRLGGPVAQIVDTAELSPRADGTKPPPDERVFGTAAAVCAAVMGGAAAVRVHNVAEMRQVVDVSLGMRRAAQQRGAHD